MTAADVGKSEPHAKLRATFVGYFGLMDDALSAIQRLPLTGGYSPGQLLKKYLISLRLLPRTQPRIRVEPHVAHERKGSSDLETMMP